MVKRQALFGRLRAYVIALAVVAGAYAARWILGPVLGDRAPFLLFIFPVVIAVLTGGRGPGLLAGLTSLIAGLSFSPAAEWLSDPYLVQAAMFLVVCAGIGVIGDKLSRERLNAQQARRTAENEAAGAQLANQQLKLLLEGASEYAIFMIDPAGNIASWNGAARRVFGWSEEEIISRHFSTLYPQDDEQIQRDAVELGRAAKEGNFRDEVWQVRRDGSEFLADVTTSSLRDEQGELIGYARVVHDVTDRRAAEISLARRERHLESILATVPDAMIVINPAGKMLSFSAAAERLFGYSEVAVVGKNVSMLMPSPDRERHDDYIRRYLETGVPRIIGMGRVVTGLRSDGSTFPMKLSVGEAQVDDQRIFTGFVQDLTETKNFEARLEQLNSELIHVSRLSAMGTMASTLAHELNQPLTAIANYGEAASSILEQEQILDRDTLSEVVSEMGAQALRAGGIVRRLRDFVARGEVNKTIEDLPKLINEAAALALVGTREKGIESNFAFESGATPVLADRVQIQQVLVNLMRNAVEAMETSPRRRLSVRTKLLDEDLVQICVADTGSGVAPDMYDRLFQAFSSTKESGMGLGLSICRTIVEAHGGRIGARPAEGGGTEFHFTLPHAAIG